jgi:hypothetical protein
MKAVLPLCIVFLLFISCHHNRSKLNTDEQKLKAEIEQEEEERKAEESTAAQITPAIHDSLASGFRLKENRTEDTANPPIILDFISTRKNVKPIKVSDLFSKIEYIRIEPDPDSLFYEPGATYIVSDKFIYAYSMNGIAQYNFDGHFLNTSVKTKVITPPIKGE